MDSKYTALLERVKEVGRLGAVTALLDWDQEVCMPEKGVTARADILAMIAGMGHEKLVSDETRQMLDAAPPTEDDATATIIREFRRDYERAVKVPTDLVKETAHVSSLAKDTWTRARKESQFEIFAPHLAQLIELRKKAAEHIGYATEPYDALMDEFEPGATAPEIEKRFAELGRVTSALLTRIQSSPHQPDASILTRHYPKSQQERLSRKFAEGIGFDFKAGRDDVSVHPFCTTIGSCQDVRITTRYMEDFFPAAIFGTLHEAGHGLYEQGLPLDHRFTPMAEAVSLGIHESQSRMWENMVGRSRAFWERHYTETQALFPDALGAVPLEDFYRAINTVSPSLIRVEADELTYNLHIVIRFEIERGLFTDKYRVDDIPRVWNETYQRLLGITPPNDADGCLQDIHWSMGAFGYFPTYALGNLYAAQLYEQAGKDIGDLTGHIRNDEHAPLLNWLRDNVHRHGKQFRAGELIERITGKPLSIEPFLNYVTEKYGEVYQL